MSFGGVTFASDYLTRGADLTGAADSKKGIISFWIKPGSGTGVENYLFQTGLGYMMQRRGSGASNPLGIRLKNSAGTVLWNRELTNFNSTTYTDWTHVAMAWDLAGPTVHYYVNGSSAGSDVVSPSNDTVDYTTTTTNWAIGGDDTGGSKIGADLAEFYFAPGQYLDLSNSANLQKFRSSGGKCVLLGSDGSTPTGTAPLIYLHRSQTDNASAFATNLGTGGTFTINGTLASSATDPPQDILVSMTGVVGTGAVGTLVATGARNVSLIGVAGTASVGVLTGQANTLVSLTGVGGTASAGSATAALQPTITGVSAIGSVGDFTFSDGWSRPSAGAGTWTPATLPPTTWTPASQGSTVWTKQ